VNSLSQECNKNIQTPSSNLAVTFSQLLPLSDNIFVLMKSYPVSYAKKCNSATLTKNVIHLF